MFKFMYRKERDSVILISGWAFDCTIFGTLNLPYNYFFFCNGNSIFEFEKGVKSLLRKNNMEKISLLGWSQGAFMACDFARKNPELVNEIILVSIKKRYKKDSLERIKAYLKKNRKAYLYKFYRECFSPEETSRFVWFKNNFLNKYLNKMTIGALIDGLDWLSQTSLEPESLKSLKKVKIVHGGEDRIAPLKDAIDIANNLEKAKLVTFEGTGHLPFLREDFKENLYGR